MDAPCVGRDEAGRVPVLILKINVTEGFNLGVEVHASQNVKNPVDRKKMDFARLTENYIL